MSTRAMGPGYGWSWLARAVNLGRGNPKAVIGGIALVALVALVPSLVQMLAQVGLAGRPDAMLTVVGLTTLVSLVVFPLLIGGALRVIDAGERGLPSRPADVFQTFRAGGNAGRLIGFGLLMTVIYLAVFGVIIGVLSALMGIGGGQLSSLFMTFYGRPIHQAIATSSGLGVLISIPGALGYIYAGWPKMDILPPLSLGYVSFIGFLLFIPTSIWTAPIGARLAHRLSKRRLEVAFGIFLLIVCARFFWSFVA